MSTSQSGSLWLKSMVTPSCTKQRPTVVANSTVNILICSTHIFMFWQNLCQCNNNPSLPTTNPKWLHSCVCSVNNSANTLLLHSLNIRATQTLLPNMGRVYFVHIKFASSNLFHFYWYFLKKKKIPWCHLWWQELMRHLRTYPWGLVQRWNTRLVSWLGHSSAVSKHTMATLWVDKPRTHVQHNKGKPQKVGRHN